MTRGTGLVVAKNCPPLELVAAVADVLAIWDADIEALPRDRLLAIRDAAAAAVQSGQAAAMAAALTAPASRLEVATEMAELIASFPQEKKNDLKAYSRFLAEDVASLGASRPALAAAAKSVRRSATFLPAIAEVMKSVESHQSQCETRAALLARLPKRIAEIERVFGIP